MVEFYAERGLCIGNTYFKHRSLHKYTRVEKWSLAKSMIDLVLVKTYMLRYMRMSEEWDDAHQIIMWYCVKSG